MFAQLQHETAPRAQSIASRGATVDDEGEALTDFVAACDGTATAPTCTRDKIFFTGFAPAVCEVQKPAPNWVIEYV